MKLTFSIPPAKDGRAAERFFGCTYQIYPQPNLVILYAAAGLEKKYQVKIIDFPILRKKLRNW